MDLSNLSNEELIKLLYSEVIYYDENLYELCKIIQKTNTS